jgi:hypothetical protein
MDIVYITRRIKEIFARDPSRTDSSRWGHMFFDKESVYGFDGPLKHVGRLTKKQFAAQQPIHIMDIDYFSLASDEKLVELFEIIIHQYYKQM